NSLKEKEILLKEVHHRVKNNLQIISSLLNLQTNYIKDEEANDLFQETKNRIKTIALVHEKLYKSSDVEHVNINHYIESIIELLSYSYDKEYIDVSIDIEEFVFEKFDMEKAIPLGLVVNEIVSNSYKHAFNKKLKGNININLYSQDKLATLIIADNGSGISKEIDLENLTSLGLELIDSLVNQLDGNYQIKNERGTTFSINFPF
ncbi:MAG: sensor histidine kinase, partial [Flavobacteriales bacterium]